MNQPLHVTKRDGNREPLDLDKIHRVIDWAAEGLQNVSVSQVELRSHIQFYDGIKTEDIHETIIKAAADLISKETPDYQYMAARLAVFHLRKKLTVSLNRQNFMIMWCVWLKAIVMMRTSSRTTPKQN
ncbi:MAG: ATP cone domain-containing protein [Rheinheimera sp.]|nr:ATP cone domain-containing protein [Rheinheimera sp.]